MLPLNTDEHLPLLFASVELDVFGCRVVTVRKKTRTIVSAREAENISAGYLEIFISFSVISLIKHDSILQSTQKQQSRNTHRTITTRKTIFHNFSTRCHQNLSNTVPVPESDIQNINLTFTQIRMIIYLNLF